MNIMLVMTYSGQKKVNPNDFTYMKSFLDKQGLSVDLDSNIPFLGIYYNKKCIYESQKKINVYDNSSILDLKQLYIMNDDKKENVIIDYKRLSKVNEKKENEIKIYAYSKDLRKCIDVRSFSMNDIKSSIERNNKK